MQKPSNKARRASSARMGRVVAGGVAHGPRTHGPQCKTIDAQCLYATYRLNRKAVKVEMTFANAEELSYARRLQDM